MRGGVAVKSNMGEDEVMVCLTLKPGMELTPEALIAHCAEQMAYFMVPRYLRFMDALPKTPTERVQKVFAAQSGSHRGYLGPGKGGLGAQAVNRLGNPRAIGRRGDAGETLGRGDPCKR